MSSTKQTFFWAISARGIQTSLIYTAAPSGSLDEGLSLVVYDCDGAEINRAEISSPASLASCVFELEYLLGLMKLESGMRHGLVMVEHPSDGALLIRYQTPHNSTLVPVHIAVSNMRQGLIPVSCNPDRRTMVALTNGEDVQIQVRGRLLIGKRSPEVTWTLEPFSSRMIEIESTFAAALGEENYLFSGRGYLRLSTGAIRGVLAHTLVQERREDETELIQIFQG